MGPIQTCPNVYVICVEEGLVILMSSEFHPNTLSFLAMFSLDYKLQDQCVFENGTLK